MAKYLVRKRFLESSGEWHHPGDVIDMDKKEAERLETRGWIMVYNTQMTAPPETRGFLGRRRKQDAIPQTGH